MPWQDSCTDLAPPVPEPTHAAVAAPAPEATTVPEPAPAPTATTARGPSLAPPRLLCAARYALAAAPLPPLTETVVVGEWARRAVLSVYGGIIGGCLSPALSGREGSEPLAGHRHAHFLPADEDGDGYIDHLTVYAAGGFNLADLEALTRLRRLWAGRHQPEVHLDLLGLYTTEGLQDAHPWCRPARVWESVTPYVLTRYPKTYRDGRPKMNDRGEQVDGPEDQARREWAARREGQAARAELVAVERVSDCALPAVGRCLPWLAYRRRRTRGNGATSGFVYGLRLTFAAPVPGPLALGYGCHFGLGQFRPM